MADPFIALMYAVQVTNFLATLVRRTLRLREEAEEMVPKTCFESEPLFDNNSHERPPTPDPSLEDIDQDNAEETKDPVSVEEPSLQENSISSDKDSAVSPQGHSFRSIAVSPLSFNKPEGEKFASHVEKSTDLPLSEITRHVKSNSAKSMTQEELMARRIEAWE